MLLSPFATDVLFIVTNAAVFLLLLFGLHVGLVRLGVDPARRTRAMLMTALALIAWLAFIAVMAKRGFYQEFGSMPPKIALAIVPTLIAVVVLGFSRKVKEIADALPPSWIIGLQSFRILIEVVLWQLVMQGRIARMMSIEGANYDLITGITAPVIAWMSVYTNNGRIQKAWNIMGLVLLANVMTRGMLNAPTRFRMIHDEPANTIIATFPYIWLPCFSVAVALFLHIVSLRQKPR
jgi:hypothetical protein